MLSFPWASLNMQQHKHFLPNCLENTWSTQPLQPPAMTSLLLLGFSSVKNTVHHFFFSAKLPLGHASLSSNHSNTAFLCFHKGFKVCLSCAKALYIPLKTINEAIPTVSLPSNCTCHPANSWNGEFSSVTQPCLHQETHWESSHRCWHHFPSNELEINGEILHFQVWSRHIWNVILQTCSEFLLPRTDLTEKHSHKTQTQQN